jgi:hypothetical protein
MNKKNTHTLSLRLCHHNHMTNNEVWVDDVSLSDKFLADLCLEAEEEINNDLHTYEMWDWWMKKREIDKDYYNEVW